MCDCVGPIGSPPYTIVVAPSMVVWSVDSDALQLHGKTIIVVVFSNNSNRRRSSRKNNRNNYNSTAVVVVGTVVAVLIKIA